MLEPSNLFVGRPGRLQTLAVGASMMILLGCADADGASAEVASPSAPTPAELRAESAAPSFDVAAAAKDDPSWTQCDEIWEFRSHGEGGLATPHVVAAGGEYHPQITFDTPWTEPVQMIAYKDLTDNKKIVHHWIFYNGSTMVTGWAPGRELTPFPTDVGMELMPGKGGIRLDMHYYNLRGGKDELDNSGIALCIVKGAARRKHTAAVHGGFSVIRELLIPANAKNFAATKTCRVTSKEPVTVLRVTPHAHQHAHHMSLSINRSSGAVETVHDGSFNFEEQDGYDLRPGVVLNEGDEVTATCVYDNDTNKNITWGENTDQEMCFLWSVYYPKGGLVCGAITPAAAPAAPASTN